MKNLPKFLAVILLGIVVFLHFFAYKTNAISSCSYTVSGSPFAPNTTSNLSITVANDGDSDLNWFYFYNPGGGYTFVDSQDPSRYEFNSVNVSPSANNTFNLNTNFADEGAYQVVVSAAPNSDGSGRVDCSGNSNIDVASVSYPHISSISLSDLSQTSVQISWATDQETSSVVEYGTTTAYGQNSTSSSLSLSHTLTITGLSANTTYHYNIKSTNSNGYTGQSGDNSFVSSKAATTSTTTVTNTVVNTTTNTVTTVIADTQKPTNNISTDFKKVYAQAPEISGIAKDDHGVSQIYYSYDDGKNWIAINQGFKVGQLVVKYKFVPEIVDDGNYDVRVKVVDTSGNEVVSRKYVLVIDQIPPTVGSVYFSSGSGNFLTSIPQDVFVSSIGGAVDMDITAINENGKSYKFKLTKNSQSGLFGTQLKFDEEGVYDLSIQAVDGAENQIDQNVGSVYVLGASSVLDINKSKLQGVQVSVYVLNQLTQSFQKWHAEPYSQLNPQITDGAGKYQFLLPPGTYYVNFSKFGYKDVNTKIFTTTTPKLYSQEIAMETGREFTFWKFRIPLYIPISIQPEFLSIESNSGSDQGLIGKVLPDTDLRRLNSQINTISLRGKPTYISIVNSWHPETGAIIREIENVAHDQRFNFIVILSQEISNMADILKLKGGYTVSIYSDTQGKLVSGLDNYALPLSLFVNKKGIITGTWRGVAGGQMIIDRLMQ